MTRIVAVSGSRSADSTTRAALSVALDAAADAGAETGMIDLGTVDLPLYHPAEDVQGDSERLTRLVREADGVLAGTPVYHGSYSSTFKNFHDFCGSDEYENTAVGLLATAGGGSYGGTLEHLRSTFRNVHAWTVPHEVGIQGASRYVETGEEPRITDDDLRRRTETLGRVVTEHAERLRG
ncbi:NADPH-dependent FMN reductase [Halorubrum lacusprofundi]|jgi:NAD(P)H-dependent FMN reductase|uniref:NADPH-dependent FMN reductase n=1 Tax=Halorubrum lacusprofundi (strain ATCC 49239 / DSM 5036 / JCM 8891 / ACAM 34) TaxID=416348 RepID=B9LU33_HALLT|nr:NADPH-dependent FMN reductase [Halorubrum lacusprofundi]ACM58227.1 NADPH-dependent FMN reductase [Halorubrum lacusprofundi ATCC 49239]MCG1006310.1 NAD(P)H-dependent oxidoreductase [Halorubrum lacusprofundi]